jgi:hypothetical protein
MTARWARFARGWAIAGFSTFVAALSHTLGGGHAPGWLGVVLSLAFAGVVCVALASRGMSLLRLSASVALSQVIFHGLFSVGVPGGALTVDAVSTSHGHETVHVLAGAGGAAPVLEPHGVGMWFFHAIAAVITVAALRYGDGIIHRILDVARLAIRRLVDRAGAVNLPDVARFERPTGPVFVATGPLTVTSSMPRRGPPALAHVA